MDNVTDVTPRPNPSQPISIQISIASACEALEYWLSNVVLQSEVQIEEVHFSEKKHFTIRLKRSSDQT